LTPKTQPANKSIASKAPITGRHHPGIPSDMISESVGDIIGIRMSYRIAQRR
jgi:ppGpp synthetase/RelA/SpoT-type nucleotidyltranferase